MTPQPHPQRCENCSNWLDANCMVIEKWLSEQEYNMIEMVGCASFNLIGSQIRSRPAPSSAPSQEIRGFVMIDRQKDFSMWLRHHDATIRNDEREKLLAYLEQNCKGRYVEDVVAEIRRFPESLRSIEAQQHSEVRR